MYHGKQTSLVYCNLKIVEWKLSELTVNKVISEQTLKSNDSIKFGVL